MPKNIFIIIFSLFLSTVFVFPTSAFALTSTYQYLEPGYWGPMVADVPADINNSGQIIGSSIKSDYTHYEFFYTNDQMLPLDPFKPSGINDQGIIAGTYENSGATYNNGQISKIAALQTPDIKSSTATDINDHGAIIGNYITNDDIQHSYIYQNGQLSTLTVLGDGSGVKKINNVGQIIGYQMINGIRHPVLYENNVITDLYPVFGEYNYNSLSDINNRGQIVGGHFMYHNGQVTDLSSLSFDEVSAIGINDKGEVVGHVAIPGSSPTTPAVYINGKWELLAYNLQRRYPSSAYKINNNNQITGITGWRAAIWTYQTEQNVVPVLGAITAPNTPVQTNTEITASATFTDLNVSDTHTAIWDWGDGTTSNGTIVEASGSGSVNGVHTYTTPGVYTIKLTVSDNNNGSATSTYQYVPIYAPTTKSASGKNEFNSPAGAISADPSATGVATFGFSAQYDANGNVIPSGNSWASLSLQEGSTKITFNATEYNWFVTNDNKAFIKGKGTYNNQPDYSILISAIDNSETKETDYIRYQIKDPSGTVVYDTQPGTADTSDPLTPISKGKIVIK